MPQFSILIFAVPLAFFFAGLPTAAEAAKWSDPSDPTTIRFGFTIPQLGLDVKEANETGAKPVNLVPNTPSRSFLSVSRDWLGATISWANPTTAEQDRLHGLSTATDYQFRFFFDTINMDFLYQRYKGYYVSNSSDFTGVDSPTTPSIQFSDLENEHAGVGLVYNFNPDAFSMAAAYDQSKKQMASGAAWLASVTFNYHKFANSGALLPPQAIGTYGAFERVRSGHFYSALIGGGGGGNWSFYGNWFLSGLFMLNIGAQVQTIESTDQTRQGSQSTTEGHAKMSLGYNGEKFIFGITAHLDSTSYRVENAEVTFLTQESAMFFGTRF